ncbi:MAG: hypothetical protein E5X33_27045 [Mesorhizobium sp.]|uniref:hypothetical protein n=1 Tax=Mesorhizobium sp. TaxID=1871066 RepID=UPI0012245E26|nr:hypothetical protein [Mesorhizobium sp.]TIR17103.1 MAG: hypothetical protein E5X33_27045 [Mesorhizobium sp.]
MAQTIFLPGPTEDTRTVCDWDPVKKELSNCETVPKGKLSKNLQAAVVRLENSIEREGEFAFRTKRRG